MNFPDQHDRELIHQAREVHRLAAALGDWAGRFGPLRRDGPSAPVAEADELTVMQLERAAANLLEAARHPVAAAVYGPSQAGKSLFVGRVLEPRDEDRSPLGRDEGHGSPGYLPGLNFEIDINPQSGSNEATAVVTRFSTSDRLPGNLPPEFPVMARALRRSELLRVLARGFAVECAVTLPPWNGETIATLATELGRRHPAGAVDPSWRRDLLDAFTYMRCVDPRRFPATEQELAAALVRNPLARDGFVELAAYLFWDHWRSLTGLFLRVDEFLTSIEAADHEPGLLVGWPAARFLLDSKRAAVHERAASRCFRRVAWSEFHMRRRGSWPVLEHCPESSACREPLETIQAALLELVVPVLPDRLHDRWREVLGQSDVLDIPGLRAGRQGAEQGKRTTADTLDEQLEILKRGKAAYLFEHYVEQMQIRTLLVLARGGNLEVTSQLKHHIDLWGRARYGAERWPHDLPAGVPALLLGLTGIDEEFRNRDEFAAPALYDARLAQLADALGPVLRPCGTAGHPPTNIYPLRYPGAWDADASQQQLETAEKWTRAGQAFLVSSEVNRYVADPADKWAAAMRDGDGGLSLISVGWRATTIPRTKQQYLATRLHEVHDELLRSAGRWMVSADNTLERDKRMACAEQVLVWLTADRRTIDDRVGALKVSLTVAEGEQYPLIDATERPREGRGRRAGGMDEFTDSLRSYLDGWPARVVEKWQRQTDVHRARKLSGGPWLDGDVVGRLSAYLRDYFFVPALFSDLASRLWSIISLRPRDEGAGREARRRYARLILNDLIWNPGLSIDCASGRNDYTAGDAAADNTFGSMTALIRRWRIRLPTALAAGAGDIVRIPPGNEELNQLLAQAAIG